MYSHISYSILLWGSSSAQNLDRIFKLQKKAIRYINHLKPLESCRDYFIRNNILTVPCIYIQEAILYVKTNNKHNITKTHEHNTRHSVFTERHKLAAYEKKPSYIGNKYFYTLPQELRAIEQLTTFKNKLKLWLLEKCFYSLEEFINWRNI